MATEGKLRKSRKKKYMTQAIAFSPLSIYPLSHGAVTNALLPANPAEPSLEQESISLYPGKVL